MSIRDNIQKLKQNMAKKLETISEGFNIFKRMTTFVKSNFVASLQTILLIVLITLVSGAIYFGYHFVERILEGYPKTTYTVEETEEGFRVDQVINELLDGMLETYGADRSKLVQFHNGTHSLGGIPFKFGSITNEAVREGVSAEIINFQNVPTSVLGTYTKQFLRGEYVVIQNTDSMEEGGFKQILQQQGVISRCMYPMIDSKGRFVGYLGLDYVKSSLPQRTDGTCVCDELAYEIKILQRLLFNSE